ncbi:maleylpyruvate isomerase N-terminal domain-containing protein [Streptomyces polyrhachis]|uniref:Maleylpyruvate isomerase N-terminal domain-containing protein n=1 Tax=Streptomyces polyrhachis TaxID=1282885 RepID=A0ABW2GCX2_9ACTN
MDHHRVLDAFAAEAGQLTDALGDLAREDWARPTGCAPWSVAELLSHVRMTAARLPVMLARRPVPARAEVSARGYYRPDERFSPATDAVRIASAQEEAAEHPDQVRAFEEVWREAYALCAAEPAERVVTTRHGDAMLLDDFLVTRVVELAVHGLDLALALERPAWTTPQGAGVVEELLLGSPAPQGVPELGWDRALFLRKATGREPVGAEESVRLEALGVHWLTLG